MSKYSGKCDFYDWFSKINDDKSIEEKLKNTKVYIGENILPLKMETYKDILPYGGYLTSNICNSDGITIIRLSTRPYVDRREEEILETEMNILKKRYRALKRKKKLKKRLNNIKKDWNSNPFLLNQLTTIYDKACYYNSFS